MSYTPIYDQLMREADITADDAHTLRTQFAVMSA